MMALEISCFPIRLHHPVVKHWHCWRCCCRWQQSVWQRMAIGALRRTTGRRVAPTVVVEEERMTHKSNRREALLDKRWQAPEMFRSVQLASSMGLVLLDSPGKRGIKGG